MNVKSVFTSDMQKVNAKDALTNVGDGACYALLIDFNLAAYTYRSFFNHFLFSSNFITPNESCKINVFIRFYSISAYLKQA